MDLALCILGFAFIVVLGLTIYRDRIQIQFPSIEEMEKRRENTEALGYLRAIEDFTNALEPGKQYATRRKFRGMYVKRYYPNMDENDSIERYRRQNSALKTE